MTHGMSVFLNNEHALGLDDGGDAPPGINDSGESCRAEGEEVKCK